MEQNMTDIQDKIKEAYIREGRIPDCLPESYREEIRLCKPTYNPYTRLMEQMAERIIASISSSGPSDHICAFGGFAERDKNLIREAIDQFNSTSTSRGFGLYVQYHTEYRGYNHVCVETANIYVGPVVE